MLLCMYVCKWFILCIPDIYTFRNTAQRTSFICIFPSIEKSTPKKIMVNSMFRYSINYSFHLLPTPRTFFIYLHITFHRNVKRFCTFIVFYILRRLSQIKEPCWVRLGTAGAIYERNTKAQSNHDPELAPQRN